jgi:hypothetical protein
MKSQSSTLSNYLRDSQAERHTLLVVFFDLLPRVVSFLLFHPRRQKKRKLENYNFLKDFVCFVFVIPYASEIQKITQRWNITRAVCLFCVNI